MFKLDQAKLIRNSVMQIMKQGMPQVQPSRGGIVKGGFAKAALGPQIITSKVHLNPGLVSADTLKGS